MHLTVREAQESSASDHWQELLGAAGGVDEHAAAWALDPWPGDLARLRSLGVPSYGFSPFETDAGTERSRRGGQEHIPLDELDRGIERYGRFVQSLLRIGSPDVKVATPAYK